MYLSELERHFPNLLINEMLIYLYGTSQVWREKKNPCNLTSDKPNNLNEK